MSTLSWEGREHSSKEVLIIFIKLQFLNESVPCKGLDLSEHLGSLYESNFKSNVLGKSYRIHLGDKEIKKLKSFSLVLNGDK